MSAGRRLLDGQLVAEETVAAGAARRGETAIGYREATPVGSGDRNARIVVNPDKTRTHVFGPGDRVIVFAED